MRISDWSSDVCSSDLENARESDIRSLPLDRSVRTPMRWTKYHSGQLHYRLQRPNLLLTLKVACGTVEMKNTALIKRKSIVCSYVDTLDLLPCGILQIVGKHRTNSPRDRKSTRMKSSH